MATSLTLPAGVLLWLDGQPGDGEGWEVVAHLGGGRDYAARVRRGWLLLPEEAGPVRLESVKMLSVPATGGAYIL